MPFLICRENGAGRKGASGSVKCAYRRHWNVNEIKKFYMYTSSRHSTRDKRTAKLETEVLVANGVFNWRNSIIRCVWLPCVLSLIYV